MTLLERRRTMAKGSSVNWKNIALGMIDGVTSFEIPTSIEVNPLQYGFYKRSNLTGTVKVKSDATTIGLGAFQESGISGVILPSTLTTIGNAAFTKSKLTSVEIPDNVTTINNDAFKQCSDLAMVTFGSSVATISTYSFQQCSKLVDIICKATTPPTINQYTFQNCTALANIYVPDASVATYKADSNWSTYSSMIKPISEMPSE